MTMDEFQTRALGNLRKRHENAIREDAGRVSEYIGYVLKRADAGKVDSAGLYVRGIAAAVDRMSVSIAALEAIAEAVGICEATEAAAEAGAQMAEVRP